MENKFGSPKKNIVEKWVAVKNVWEPLYQNMHCTFRYKPRNKHVGKCSLNIQVRQMHSQGEEKLKFVSNDVHR